MAPQSAEAALQQSGAGQREPSMEEILASIRRIIEDSDSGRPGEASAIPEAANTSKPSPAKPDREVDAFRDELGSAAEVSSPFPSVEVPLTADVEKPVDQVVETVAKDEPAPKAKVETAVHPRAERPLLTARIEPSLTAETMKQEWRQRLSTPAAPASVASTVTAAMPSTPPAAEVETEADRSDTARGSIISEVAGRQVAAAFGELSDAFAASRRRSFDEVAEEMMRPMLQEWLDNNLPTLVERLVREEIERVARGTPR